MSWFDCKITYEKEQNQGGRMKKVSESYLVDAVSFTEAEAYLAEMMQSRGVYVVDSVRKIKLYELFLDHKSQYYYKAKVAFITLDEKSGEEKKTNVQMIIQAEDFDHALESLHQNMSDTMSDYEVAKLEETKYMDVIEYQVS